MTSINGTGDKFFAGVVDTAEQFIAIREYLRKFSKKIQNGPMEYLGAWGTLIHEKNLKSEISCQTPFKEKNSSGINKIREQKCIEHIECRDKGGGGRDQALREQ